MSSKECETQLKELIEAWDLDEATLNATDIEAIKHLLLENKMQHDEIIKLQNIYNELKKYIITELDEAQQNYENRDIDRFELAVRKNVLLKLQLKINGLEKNN